MFIDLNLVKVNSGLVDVVFETADPEPDKPTKEPPSVEEPKTPKKTVGERDENEKRLRRKPSLKNLPMKQQILQGLGVAHAAVTERWP